MLKNRTISSILRYCKTKPRFLDIVTKTALFQNRTNQGRVIPRPYCILFELQHTSEITDLCSMKCSKETLQNLLYFMYKKTHVVFFSFLLFPCYEYPGKTGP